MSNTVCQTTLAFHSHTQITARFDGGNLTSDAGWLLFGSLDRQDRLCEDFSWGMSRNGVKNYSKRGRWSRNR